MEKDKIEGFVVIGGSAGSLDVILRLAAHFPVDRNLVYVIVVHRKNDSDSHLVNLLASRTALSVQEVEDKEEICTNRVYVAPADYHLLIEANGFFSLDSSEKIHYSRPSIDVTFESVAEVFGEKSIGLLLSGANADGAAGLKKIKAAGGTALVQSPGSADVAFMPEQAIKANAAHRILNVEEMITFFADLNVRQ